jgi:hypothetical protein
MAGERQKWFPRTTTLPSQSPLFWVEQKDRYLRQLLIEDIEALTKRRLVTYFANRVENPQLDARDTAYLTELLGDVGKEPVDLLLETIGGYTDATEAAISLIKNMVTDLRVIVAGAAKSNGTLLCLAARSIVMGAASELGPIDPSIQNVPCTILAVPNPSINTVLQQQAVYALKQTIGLAKSLLAAGMMNGKPDAEIEDLVKKLSTRDKYFSHGSVINHEEATALGLTVEYLPPEDEIWKRIWLLYCMYDFDCRKNRYIKVFEGRARSSAIAAPPAPPAKGP